MRKRSVYMTICQSFEHVFTVLFLRICTYTHNDQIINEMKVYIYIYVWYDMFVYNYSVSVSMSKWLDVYMYTYYI